MANLIYSYLFTLWIDTVFQIILLLLALNGFSYACERPTLRRINPRGFTSICHINNSWREKFPILYKVPFKRVNGYLSRCLEVNTLVQLTKQPDYPCWALYSKFSTYRPEKYFYILFLLWKFCGKNFAWWYVSVTLDISQEI